MLDLAVDHGVGGRLLGHRPQAVGHQNPAADLLGLRGPFFPALARRDGSRSRSFSGPSRLSFGTVPSGKTRGASAHARCAFSAANTTEPAETRTTRDHCLGFDMGVTGAKSMTEGPNRDRKQQKARPAHATPRGADIQDLPI